MHYRERCVPLIPEEMKKHSLLSEIHEQLLLNHWEFSLSIWQKSLFCPLIITPIWCYSPFTPLLLLPPSHDLSELKTIQYWNTAASQILGYSVWWAKQAQHQTGLVCVCLIHINTLRLTQRKIKPKLGSYRKFFHI